MGTITTTLIEPWTAVKPISPTATVKPDPECRANELSGFAAQYFTETVYKDFCSKVGKDKLEMTVTQDGKQVGLSKRMPPPTSMNAQFHLKFEPSGNGEQCMRTCEEAFDVIGQRCSSQNNLDKGGSVDVACGTYSFNLDMYQAPGKQCYKQDAVRMKDHANWKFVDQVRLDAAIDKYCRDDWSTGLNSPPWTEEKAYYTENDDWDAVKFTISGTGDNRPNKDQCKDALMQISAGCDHDPEPDVDKNINQYNWKWGGELIDNNGIKWTIEPQKSRVATSKPEDRSHGLVTDSRQCYSLAKFSDKGNKGVNGKDLDDTAKMTLQECVHRLRLFDDDLDVSCGGYLMLGFHRKAYNDIKSCAENTWQCLSYYVEQGESARGEHHPGFSNCWADLMFRDLS